MSKITSHKFFQAVVVAFIFFALIGLTAQCASADQVTVRNGPCPVYTSAASWGWQTETLEVSYSYQCEPDTLATVQVFATDSAGRTMVKNAIASGPARVDATDLGISQDVLYCAYRIYATITFFDGMVHYADLIRPAQFPPQDPVRCTRTNYGS